jgi:hypothetical protein
MYRKKPKGQMSFEDFYLPFGGRLNGENRWIQLALEIPWEEFEGEYAKGFSTNGIGAPAKSLRMALGAAIIKRKLDITDEEVVEQIRENPYLQYFIGMEGYRDEAPFDPSMMTHFRERLTLEMLNRVNERVIETKTKKKEPKEIVQSVIVDEGVKNEGKLLLDATCIPQDIRYPTDLSLLNEVRQKTEKVIDRLHEAHCVEQAGLKHQTEYPKKKPRTYRKKARKDYLSLAKQRKKSKKLLRRGIRKQLQYVRRNLKTIEKQVKTVGLTGLSRLEYRNLLVCQEVFRQQEQMYRKGEQRVDDRIVSLTQPHIRPIKRGKAGAETEFGSKLTISVVGGFTRIEKLSWDNYNEGTLLIGSVEAYKKRYGYYPVSVHVDKIFVTNENRKYCKEHGVRISGPPLGRPSGDMNKNRAAKKLEKQDAKDRIPVEGKFGNCKRKYGLDRIFTKKKNTSECEIALGILLLNLDKPLCGFIFAIFYISAFFAGIMVNERDKSNNTMKLAA